MPWLIEFYTEHPVLAISIMVIILASLILSIVWMNISHRMRIVEEAEKLFPNTDKGRDDISVAISHYEHVYEAGHLDPRSDGYLWLEAMKKRQRQMYGRYSYILERQGL